MQAFQRSGGLAALLCAATFLVGFALYFTVLAQANYGSLAIDPRLHVEFLRNNAAVMYAWYFIIYCVFGLSLVVLALALDRQFSRGSALARLATIYGCIWAGLVIATGMVANVGFGMLTEVYTRSPEQATAMWLSLSMVINGLGGGNEVVGGCWVLLVSVAGLRHQVLPRWLNMVGLVVALAGVVTAFPPLKEVGALFGLGSILWFIAVGIVLLTRTPPFPDRLADVAAP